MQKQSLPTACSAALTYDRHAMPQVVFMSSGQSFLAQDPWLLAAANIQLDTDKLGGIEQDHAAL